MNEPVLTCKIVAVQPDAVVLELVILGQPPVIAVMGRGTSFAFRANIIEPPVIDVSGAELVLDRIRRESRQAGGPPSGAPQP